MSARCDIKVSVNGEAHEASVEPRLLLADFLREHLNLTGTHIGCEHGVCGACTVFLDGDSVRSCLCLAVQADGAEVETVESFGRTENLNPLQEKFREQNLEIGAARSRRCPGPSGRSDKPARVRLGQVGPVWPSPVPSASHSPPGPQ